MGGAVDDDGEDGPDTGPVAPSGSQRLDKWLWFARVTKSRTLAAGLVSDGRVRLNRERIEKPAALVKAGDVLTIAVGARVRILEVVSPGKRRGPAPEAQALYRDLSPPPPPKEEAVEPPGAREPGSGRPTKRDRRQIGRFTGED